jgi:hypothetical protein
MSEENNQTRLMKPSTAYRGVASSFGLFLLLLIIASGYEFFWKGTLTKPENYDLGKIIWNIFLMFVLGIMAVACFWTAWCVKLTMDRQGIKAQYSLRTKELLWKQVKQVECKTQTIRLNGPSRITILALMFGDDDREFIIDLIQDVVPKDIQRGCDADADGNNLK